MQVDQSKLYLLDAAIQPDREDDAVLAAKLAGLKDDGMAHDGGGEGEERGTYSHLVKPALNSAANPFTVRLRHAPLAGPTRHRARAGTLSKGRGFRLRFGVLGFRAQGMPR
eukprot:202221-Chlamydomonas_euryale.AAC.1